jgi:ATP-dependent helicase/nuclease subunit A
MSPYVIYSELSKNFNKGDLRKPLILNQKYGLGIDYFDDLMTTDDNDG